VDFNDPLDDDSATSHPEFRTTTDPD